MGHVILASSVLVMTLPVTAAAGDWWGRVGGVTDGDTLMVLHKQRWPVHLDLYGVDAPELSQPHGKQARELTAKMVYGKQVRVVPRGKGNRGQALALIYVGSECLNERLVEAGLAWLTPGNKAARYKTRLKKAKAAAKGLWADASSVPPWRWTAPPPGKKKGERKKGDLNEALDMLSGAKKGDKKKGQAGGASGKNEAVALKPTLSAKDRLCRRHTDCVFRFRPPCYCPPCGGVWRRATNRKTFDAARKHWANKKPRCKPCPLCVQPTIWIGKKALCLKRRCTVR